MYVQTANLGVLESEMAKDCYSTFVLLVILSLLCIEALRFAVLWKDRFLLSSLQKFLIGFRSLLKTVHLFLFNRILTVRAAGHLKPSFQKLGDTFGSKMSW